MDAVFEGDWGDWAVEVKTSSFDSHELKGLLQFCRRNSKFRPLVITAPDDERIAHGHGLSAISWNEFLVSGPPSSAKTIGWPEGACAEAEGVARCSCRLVRTLPQFLAKLWSRGSSQLCIARIRCIIVRTSRICGSSEGERSR